MGADEGGRTGFGGDAGRAADTGNGTEPEVSAQSAGGADAEVQSVSESTVTETVFAVTRSGDTTYWKANTAVSPEEILRAAANTDHNPQFDELGVALSEAAFAEIEQSVTLGISVDIDLDHQTADIFEVNGGRGGVADPDRTSENFTAYHVSLDQYKPIQTASEPENPTPAESSPIPAAPVEKELPEDYAERIHVAFNMIRNNPERGYSERQLKFLQRLEVFAVQKKVTEDLVDEALKLSVFKSTYGNRKHLSQLFNARLGRLENDIEDAMDAAFADAPKRQGLYTLQDVVNTYFSTDCVSAETEDGTWKIAAAEGDKVGELLHNGTAVCGIYNRGDHMEVEPYQELTSFPKLLSDAMLAHNPDKSLTIMEYKRTFETLLEQAKHLINDFCKAEYGSAADFSDLSKVDIAYTTLTDDELPVQVTADLVNFKISYEFDGEVFNVEQYDNIEEMVTNGLTGLDFSELVSVPENVIEQHTQRSDQAVATEPSEPEKPEQAHGTFEIYQMKSGEQYHYNRFESYESNKDAGLTMADYDLVYSGDLADYPADNVLEAIFDKFNLDIPEDFRGHSLSMSDVVVMTVDGEKKAFYCDKMDYKEFPGFFNEKKPVEEQVAAEQPAETDATGSIPVYTGEWEIAENRDLYWQIRDENERFAARAREVIDNGRNPVESMKTLTEEFGFERTAYLTALNIIAHPGDGRFYQDQKQWACDLLSPYLEVHPDEVLRYGTEKQQLFDRMINGGTLYSIHNTHLSQFAEVLIPEYIRYLEQKQAAQMKDAATAQPQLDTNVNSDTEYHIHFGLLGNGITAYDVSRTDPETHDYPNVAHISEEGNVTFYDQDLSAEDIDYINHEAERQRAEFEADWNSYSIEGRYDLIVSRSMDRLPFAQAKQIRDEKLPIEEIVKKYEHSVIFMDEPFPEESRMYQLVTNAGSDGGFDEKKNYATLEEPVKAGRDYIADGYLGFSVLNTDTKIIEHTEGDFPVGRAFSEDILKQNGILPEPKPVVTDQADETFEQMSLLDEPEPVSFDALLSAEIDRGTGFENGKLRVQAFYDTQNPTTNELAKFLKDAYGIGGHSGDENVRFVQTDGSGMHFEMQDGEDHRFSWQAVAKAAEEKLHDGTYLNADQRAAYDRMQADHTPDDAVAEEVDTNVNSEPLHMVALTTEEQQFLEDYPELDEPEVSPWGEVDQCRTLYKSVFEVQTPGHGGVMIEEELANCILSPEAREIGFVEGGYHCYEEDCDAQVPLRELIAKGLLDLDAYVEHYHEPDTGETKQDWMLRMLDESNERFHPEYAAAFQQQLTQANHARLQADAARVVKSAVDYYDKLYGHDEEFADYQTAMETGQTYWNEHPDFAQAYGAMVSDAPTSDRELAALGYALAKEGLAPDFRNPQSRISMAIPDAMPQPGAEVAATSTNPDDDAFVAFETAGMQIDSATEKPVEVPASEQKSRRGKTIGERLYDKLEQMFPEILNGNHTYERYGEYDSESGYEPISVEHLGGDKYGFMTSYVQNGDLMRDPDFTFHVDKENRTVVMSEFQMDGVPGVGTVYQCVEQEDGTLDLRLEKELAKNFLQNLRNADPNRVLTAYTDASGEERQMIPVKPDDPDEVQEEQMEPYAEFREILNQFSQENGLGELRLNVEGSTNYCYVKVSEVFNNGESLIDIGFASTFHGDLNPFTLQERLNQWIDRCKTQGDTLPSETPAHQAMEQHYGLSELPKVPDSLPQIVYAKNPSQKLRDNVEAIRELKRLKEAEESGAELYVKKHPKYAAEKTKEESDEILRRYSGWGGLQEYFAPNGKQQNTYQARALREILTEEEYEACRATVTDAHYTPQFIVDAMYQAIKTMGLPEDARILEPSCGTGNFISRMPAGIGNGGVVGVEIDPITAEMARFLHNGDSRVQIVNSGFERTDLPNNSFDLAIGNVPFGNYRLYDPDYPQNWQIHDSFFRRALDKVAPGGVVAFITDKGTMDKQSPKIREYLATQAELVGAVRLPNTAFADAGTGVTSDIIFLKKREHPLQPHEAKPDWCYVKPNADGLTINSYFVDNPQMMLGTMKQTTFQNRLTCEPFPDADLRVQLRHAMQQIRTRVVIQHRERAAQKRQSIIEPWGKNDSYQYQDGKFYFRSGDHMDEIKVPEKHADKMKQLIALRDTIRELLDKQTTHVPDAALEPLRTRLNEQYDAYVEKYGTLHESAINLGRGVKLSADIDYPVMMALEDVDPETSEITKAAIFTERTVNPVAEITSVETLDEAFVVSMDQRGKVDIPYMATLLMNTYGEPDKGLDEICTEVLDEMLDKGMVYIDPEQNLPGEPFSGIVEPAEYLSGNVRRKLTMAQEAAKRDPETYTRNVEALTEVIPEDIHAEEITCRIGCTWVDAADYEAFLCELSGRSENDYKHQVAFSPQSGAFDILHAASQADLNPNETTTYGTKKLTMYQIAEALMNQRRIQVLKTIADPMDPSKTITRTDAKATKRAHEKAEQIAKKFEEWIFATPERKKKYERIYNDRFNSIVGRTYDGSHLTFNGMANDFHLLPHQMNCVARAVYGGNTLAAHVVGAGKSAVISSTVMKKKQLGLISKACVVVPKPLTEQTGREWRRVFPDAKILTVTNMDLSTEEKRKAFTAKIATGNYDAVIMSQEQFEKMPMSKEYQSAYIRERLSELRTMLDARMEVCGHKKRDFTVRALETLIKRENERLEAITNPKSKSKAKDQLLDFEALGFDYLVVDEAHSYKNGFVATKMTNVSGVNTAASGRAQDMQMKCDYFNQQLGQSHILYSTGTPVSNSMTEMYVMTRYLRPDLLERAGVSNFDEWAATFGRTITSYQQDAAGRLKLKTSFAKFANLPELMAMYKEFADIQSAEKLHLPRPELKGGKPQIIKVEASPEQRAYVKELAARAKAIQDGRVRPNVDNLLKITGEARMIGMGNQAIAALYKQRGMELPPDFTMDTGSKVDACVDQVKALYDESSETKGVQIIFSDIAVNGDDMHFSVYEYLRDQLIAKGVPADEIVFAPKSDSKEREQIFRDINDSKYRVIIASTGTLGTGANIQKNLYALHHLDIPWKPADFSQREGRILRRGNQNKEVQIFNYVTEGTLDSYLYQVVTNKAKFIAQILDDKCPARVSEDCDEKVLTFGELQAAAEGDPRFRERIELQNQVAEIAMLRGEYHRETGALREKLEAIPARIEKLSETAEQIKKDIAASPVKVDGEGKSYLTIKTDKGVTMSDADAINKYIKDTLETNKNKHSEVVAKFTIGAFSVSLYAGGAGAMQPPYMLVKGERAGSYEVPIGTDNNRRLLNLFEKKLDSELETALGRIDRAKEDAAQIEERLEQPYPREDEYLDMVTRLTVLESELAADGMLDQVDALEDPQEDTSVETPEERKEREAKMHPDDDNFDETDTASSKPSM
ncbi:MAG: hypothetical protein K5695_13505 [Oscillospiraceae bacterium]|nr:hypothetical protein [Oscillospiraceae bacterium]